MNDERQRVAVLVKRKIFRVCQRSRDGKGDIMKGCIYMVCWIFLIAGVESAESGEKKWWQKWPTHPKGLRITAEQVKSLQLAGEKVLFVYSGYEGGEGDRIVCGSLVIPYNKVPPFGNGLSIKVRIPKDWWVICY